MPENCHDVSNMSFCEMMRRKNAAKSSRDKGRGDDKR
jgi:hypothetical protein